MGKWEFKLPTQKLRKLINEEQKVEIIKELQNLYRSILAIKSINEDLKYEVQEALILIDGDDEVIEKEEFEDYGWENGEELVNDRLNTFYDICDGFNIWCEL